jgi:hypothetical protein
MKKTAIKTAVLYTGEIRTIEKTFPFFVKNVVSPTQADVFATLQKHKEHPEIHSEHFTTLSWFSREDYNACQDGLLQSMAIDSGWKQYLKTSGSMIEYYQLFLSFLKMREFEEANGFRYDCIVRIRTDVVICRPIDVSWVNWSYTDIEKRWNTCCILSKGNHDDKLLSFFHSVMSNDPLCLFRSCSDEIVESYIHKNEEGTIENLHHYLQTGTFLMTVRKNVFYMGKRKAFESIHELGITFGQWLRNDLRDDIRNDLRNDLRNDKDIRNDKRNDQENWFDAESQLEAICQIKQVSLFNLTTRLEAESLYHYENNKYFNYEDKLLPNPSVFCFICRIGKP